MKWVTWQNVGVDRMACAWLILRRIDPKAEFIFIPEGELTIPKATQAFDIPGVRLSHHQGHCSFHAFLKKFKLTDPVLARIAEIVDEADTVQEVLVEPTAMGLDFICRGMRRMSPDDRTAIDRGCMVYDALYAELAAQPR